MVLVGLRFFFLKMKKGPPANSIFIWSFFKFYNALMHLAFAFGEVLMFFLICASFLLFHKSLFFLLTYFLCLLFSSFPPFLSLFLSFLCSPSFTHTFLHIASLYHSKIIFFLLSTSVVHFRLLLTLISFANLTSMFPKHVSCQLHCLSPLCTLSPIAHH